MLISDGHVIAKTRKSFIYTCICIYIGEQMNSEDKRQKDSGGGKGSECGSECGIRDANTGIALAKKEQGENRGCNVFV